ncbi:MAG: WD40/YVTN/BNR-like repeat-containing protein [Thermoanaerobaculia bacterium]
MSPVSPSVVYAAAYVLDFVLLGDGLGVLRTLDGGLTWTSADVEEIFPRLAFLTVRWITVDPSRPHTVFAGGFGSEIYRSVDAGESFFPIPLDPAVGVVNSVAVDPKSSLRVYAATASRGVLASEDGGFHFTQLNCLLPHLSMTDIVVSPAGNALHVGTQWAGVFDYDMSSPAVAPLCPQHDVIACLQGGRFCVGITWGIGSDALPRRASAVTLTPDTAAFWFFDASNLEVMLKVLDGTRINGRFWVFYGSLSNIEYEITVTDNETGRTRTYRNIQQVASVTDTEAF